MRSSRPYLKHLGLQSVPEESDSEIESDPLTWYRPDAYPILTTKEYIFPVSMSNESGEIDSYQLSSPRLTRRSPTRNPGLDYESPLLSLPIENVYHILINTPLLDLQNVCKSSQLTRKICQQDFIWRAKFLKDFPGLQLNPQLSARVQYFDESINLKYVSFLTFFLDFEPDPDERYKSWGPLNYHSRSICLLNIDLYPFKLTNLKDNRGYGYPFVPNVWINNHSSMPPTFPKYIVDTNITDKTSLKEIEDKVKRGDFELKSKEELEHMFTKENVDEAFKIKLGRPTGANRFPKIYHENRAFTIIDVSLNFNTFVLVERQSQYDPEIPQMLEGNRFTLIFGNKNVEDIISYYLYHGFMAELEGELVFKNEFPDRQKDVQASLTNMRMLGLIQ